MKLTRRALIQGLITIGSILPFATVKATEAATIKEDFNPTDVNPDKEGFYWTTGPHNCGTGVRCASKVHLYNGRVVRITTDDSDVDWKGHIRDKNMFNDSRSLACTRCKSYKYRLYHAGRLKYPLMQTKQRGDMTGFVRVTSERALKDIARKYRAIFAKYGSGAILNTYGTSTNYGGTFGQMGDARDALTTYIGGIQPWFSDYSYHQNNYAWNLTGHPNIGSSYDFDATTMGAAIPHIEAGIVKNLVSWGSNIMTTSNAIAYPYSRAVERMKEQNPNAKVYHISPEFVDTGVVIATDWVQVRNYTDAALIMAMIHEMIVNTFDKNGNIVKNPYLDVDYLDTLVYGFFDSPEYWVNPKTGVISFNDPGDGSMRRINAVPAGRSLSAYVMGDDDRLTKAKYSDGNTYYAQMFAKAGAKGRNGSICSYPVKGKSVAKDGKSAVLKAIEETNYEYKKDLLTPKTPEWAEKICGTPASTIRELAKMYCDPAQHPIVNEWCGGFQKQDNGVVQLYSLASLMCITKTFGLNGEGLYGAWGSRLPELGDFNEAASGSRSDFLSTEGILPANRPELAKNAPVVPDISVKEWFNGIKMAFHEELVANGYTAKHIPYWNPAEPGADRFVNDDGGTKASIMLKRNPDGSIKTYTEKGKVYADFIGRDTSGKGKHKPQFVGTRMIIIHGGNIQVNQHSNSNDNTDVYKRLSLASKNPDDPDTFCLVTFDPFLSPTARYADYIFPATISLEAGDWTAIAGQPYHRPAVTQPPGETKDGWTYAYEAYKVQAELGDFKAQFDDFKYERKVDKNAHLRYVGTEKTTKAFRKADTLTIEMIDKAVNDKNSRFYGMTREDVISKQFRPRQNHPAAKITLTKTPIREKLDSYLALPVEKRRTTPFVFTGENTWVEASKDNGYKWDFADYRAEGVNGRPNYSGKMHVYNEMATWEYEHRYSKFHGWLPEERRGQSNADYEGDKHTLPIPMYFNFEDNFKESYGVMKELAAGRKPAWDMKDGLTLSTTHDRYRSHSSLAENPLLRELNHRTVLKTIANDWNEYAAVEGNSAVNKPVTGISPMISNAVYKKNKDTASWHEVWINSEDAKERGIADGDLIMLENPIGKVRVIARLTDRCIRGHINLHQGGWYDPNPIDGVDDGGCANTLTSSKPSRFDLGNSQQMCMVKVTKVANFFK